MKIDWKNKEQKRLYNKEYRKNHIDYFRKYDYEYYRKNKERINKRPRNMEKKRAYDKRYYYENKKKSHQNYLNFKEKNPNYSKEYYLKNKDYLKKKHTEYYKKNKQRINKKNSEYGKRNREKFRAYSKKHREKNPERINWLRRLRNKRRKGDRQYIICNRLRSSFNRVFKIYINTGKVYPSNQYGIDYQAIIEHLKPFPTDLSKYHIDHIKPLASFKFINPNGSTNLEEIRKAFKPKNHQWMIVKENISKGKKIEKQLCLNEVII